MAGRRADLPIFVIILLHLFGVFH